MIQQGLNPGLFVLSQVTCHLSYYALVLQTWLCTAIFLFYSTKRGRKNCSKKMGSQCLYLCWVDGQSKIFMFLEKGQLTTQIDNPWINGVWHCKVDQFTGRNNLLMLFIFEGNKPNQSKLYDSAFLLLNAAAKRRACDVTLHAVVF